MLRAILSFLLSLKTAFWLFVAFVVNCLIGSLSLPANLAFFSGIDDSPLFAWLRETGAPGTTWWIYALIGLLAVFAVSTICCTVDALLERSTWRSIALKLSPQVMHAGVLFIMLGHLLTATLGEKIDIDVKKGESAPVGSAAQIMLVDVQERTDENGYAVDWEATLRWIENGRPPELHRLRPARPLYFGAYGLYTKAVDPGPRASAWIRVSRDPGALWALLGGLLLSLGGTLFLYGKFGPASSSRQRRNVSMPHLL